MEQIVIKKEPEGLLEHSEGSGKVTKQEIKEELDYCDNSMNCDELGVKEESETSSNEGVEQFEMKFEAEDEKFLDKGRDSDDLSKEILEKSCEKLFECDLCDKKYQRRNNLNDHVKYVHGKHALNKLKCDHCDYVTVRKNSFKMHLKIHDKKTHLKCNFCEYTAAHLIYLNAHILRKHKLENKGDNKIKITSKIYTCTKCSYSNVRKSNYDNHIKICLNLKNVKWYKCHLCHYKSIQKSSLKNHIIRHNKIKELNCSFCKYHCFRKPTLDYHILTTHSDLLNESNKHLITSKTHCCQHCNYKTIYENHFKNHNH
ncbi:unnamed protein product [Brassicogethes aeneus]|uniref:C2H2-type domain-containing protein n=1 Tax=Brassicogethes aeneus TaxID=1431903 RepID=A0A9P0FDA3_BRAAE|nr:unnamed protein product [Brassicogethes aeneus]